MQRKSIGILVVSLALLAIIAWLSKDALIRQAFAPRQPDNTNTTTNKLAATADTEVVAENLTIPWELVFLPDNSLLVSERPGQLIKIDAQRRSIPISGVEHTGEGGLLGMALHPEFSSNNYLYLYLTTAIGDTLTNRVERYQLIDNTLINQTTIIANIPGARNHDGGRIAFGPDEKLYITTGDAGHEPNAQNPDSLAGKILRINDDGSIPADNPFATAVYSLGHRNPQGLAWDGDGRLWITEHGRSGLLSGFDEINLITPGGNYGWPTIEGDETKSGLRGSVRHSGSDQTWAPSGAAVFGDSLLFAGLRGEALYQAQLDGNTITQINTHFPQVYGRLRTVVIGPDDMLYIVTNNQDGRGTPRSGDDKIIRLDPKALGL